MSAEIIVAPGVYGELAELADFMARTSPRTALRFLDAAEAEFASLAALPGLAGVYETSNPPLAGLRVWPIPSFPKHLIFYRPTPKGIEVVHVLHGMRDLENYPGR